MKKILGAVLALFITSAVQAQTLPAGYIGTVTSNTPNTWQTYTYTFTPTQTGANYIGFAFRQDPAYWTFDNVRLTVSGSSTNLLTNGGFNTGGSFNVTTSNGPSSIQAPTNWGVWYQNGTYPAAAGTWTDIGGTQGGVWYDGAVGTFDGIYQGVVLQAGTTYTITFDVSGNHTSNGGSVQLGIYGGACDNASIAASQCTIPSSAGFTTLATPEQGAAAGNPTPTIVSTASATALVATTTTFGASSTTTQVVDVSNSNRVRFTVTRTRTPITSTPWTTTTVTTPRITQTWSDGSTTTVDDPNNASTTTTTNGIIVTTGTATQQTQTAASNTLRDQLSINTLNPFLVDPLSLKDGVWSAPVFGYHRAGGSVRATGITLGVQGSDNKTTIGGAFRYQEANAHSYLNAESQAFQYHGVAYILHKLEEVWVKGLFGIGNSNYTTTTSIPTFSLSNQNKVNQRNYYADLTLYTPNAFGGFRPLVGVLVNGSQIVSQHEVGTPLLSTLPGTGTQTYWMPYVGTRYEVTDNISLETRLTHNKDYGNIVQNRVSIDSEIYDNVFLEGKVGFDKGSNYTAGVGTIGLKIKF
jgi:hypothetical protein